MIFLTLVKFGGCQAETADVIWGYVSDYAPDVVSKHILLLGEMVQYAVNYYQDLVRPTRISRCDGC